MEQNEYTVKEIIDSACGKDDKGSARSVVGLFYENLDADGEVTETVNSVNCDSPAVTIIKRYEYFFIDLVFPTHLDTNLSLMNNLLKDAFAASDSFDQDKETFPLITLTIVPHEFGGRYYMICTDPAFWALTTQSPNGEFNTIRFVFDEEDFSLMEADEEVINQMMQEAAAELAAQERKEEFYLMKDAERKAGQN